MTNPTDKPQNDPATATAIETPPRAATATAREENSGTVAAPPPENAANCPKSEIPPVGSTEDDSANIMAQRMAQQQAMEKFILRFTSSLLFGQVECRVQLHEMLLQGMIEIAGLVGMFYSKDSSKSLRRDLKKAFDKSFDAVYALPEEERVALRERLKKRIMATVGPAAKVH